jgi:hypothetical protein
MKSIIQEEKKCFICGQTYWLESHHCLHGTANRKLAEKYGLKVWLCQEHHRGNSGVHKNHMLDLTLKSVAQKKFEETHSRKEFIKIFGKSYL